MRRSPRPVWIGREILGRDPYFGRFGGTGCVREGFFSVLTRRRLRCTFTGVVDLQAAIKRSVADHDKRAALPMDEAAANIVDAVSRLL